MTRDDAIELFARATLHEFALEVLFANFCRRLGPDAEAFLTEFEATAQKLYGPLAHTPETIEQMQADAKTTAQVTANFCRKIRQRATDAG